MNHLLFPFLSGKDLQTVLALLGNLDINQEIFVLLYAISGIAGFRTLKKQKNEKNCEYEKST